MYVEGHHPAISSRDEMEVLNRKLRLAEKVAREGAAIGTPDDDDDTKSFLAAFKAGHATDL
jgi:hypothetical protein